MARPRAQPANPLSLGLAGADPQQHPVPPPQIEVPLPPPIAVAVHQAVLPQPPVGAAVAQQHANNQPGVVPPPGVTPPPAAPSAAQSLATRLLGLDPTMTLNQLTGILNILAPNRHTRTVAANLLQFAPQPPRTAPPSASAPTLPPLTNPLTGARIVTPQRRAQPAPESAPARSLLDLLSAPSRKRSVLHPPSPSPLYKKKTCHINT